MKQKILLGMIIMAINSNSLFAKDRSMHCKLFEVASGKMLTMGGAFAGTRSGAPDEVDQADYALVVDRTTSEKPSLKVVNKQKKAVISATFSMSKKEDVYPSFQLSLVNEQEGLRLDCVWK